ncbi:unnamed protein product [Hermetia illucens]|uniref:SCP domain-containing protein n=1 Tax=Hermetia illucens TaxID=343691 RepID=A0A7R8V4Z3_HERIL|nr:antigen 5 like allergen Cul n 1-like [Hermetia illucens]CAD7092945.1 unnamed protein product [Hermetia illucens]
METAKLFYVLALLVLGCSAEDYCSEELCQVGDPPTTAKHIDCNNNGKFGAACSSNARVVDISAQQDLIIQMINVRRNTVALGKLSPFPTAARMPTVTWSSDLSRLAALSSKRCLVEHDACRNTYTFRKVAQLVFQQYSQGVNINYREHLIKMIQTWYQKYKDADEAKIASYTKTNPNYSPFAILVNQKVISVGCGTTTWKNDGRLFVTTICNFASRNEEGSPVYESGDTASSCTTGTNPDYPGLCSKDEEVDPN